MAKKLSKGFTLVELLIVVAIIGIIAAIAIPNLITAIQRGKQKRTVGDIRNIGTAMEEYVVDEASCVATAGSVNGRLNQAYFVPFYVKIIPTRDGWRTDMRYEETNAFTAGVPFSYSIISYGRDKTSGPPAAALEYDSKSFFYDIYFSDGSFTYTPGAK